MEDKKEAKSDDFEAIKAVGGGEGKNKNLKHDEPKKKRKRPAKYVIKNIWNYLFGILISLVGGTYLGLSSLSMKESWHYCIILIVESVVCLLLTIFLPTHSARKAISAFILYFFIAGLMSPVASWLGLQLS